MSDVLMSLIVQIDVCNEPTELTHTYISKETWDKMMDSPEFKRLRSTGNLLVYLSDKSMPDVSRNDFWNCCGVIRDVFIKDCKVYTEIDILDTPNGHIATTLLSQKIKLEFEIRGVGDTYRQPDKNVIMIKPGTFQFYGLNIVCNNTWDSKYPRAVLIYNFRPPKN